MFSFGGKSRQSDVSYSSGSDGYETDSNSSDYGGSRSRASSKFSSIKSKMSGKVNDAKSAVSQKVVEAKTKLRANFEEKLDKATSVLTDVIMKRVSETVKVAVKDDSMPNVVKRGIDGVVDEVMEEVEIEVKGKFDQMTKETTGIDQGKERRCFPWLPCWFRNWVLYTMFPYDKTIWQSLRTFSWWFLKLVSMVPVRGVFESFFFILLIFEDKGDEFRLINYILGFKGTAFISMGVIPIIVGAARMVACGLKNNPTCITNGPELEYWEAGFFGLQIVLMWIAVLLLPFSRKKGAVRFRHEDPNERQGKCFGCCCSYYKGRGGHLWKFVLWDTITFLGCAGVMIYLTMFSKYKFSEKDKFKQNEWLIRQALYWLKCLHGLLSFPFLAFQLPLVGGLLSHAKPTAYNPNGKVMAVIATGKEADREKMREKMKAEQEKWNKYKKELEMLGEEV